MEFNLIGGFIYFLYTKNKEKKIVNPNTTTGNTNVIDTIEAEAKKIMEFRKANNIPDDYPLPIQNSNSLPVVVNNINNSLTKNWSYIELSKFAKDNGFTVTSTNKGNHVKGSKHYQGKAIDVRTSNKTNAQVNAFITKARELGITVYDERTDIFKNGKWTGAHLHLEV